MSYYTWDIRYFLSSFNERFNWCSTSQLLVILVFSISNLEICSLASPTLPCRSVCLSFNWLFSVFKLLQSVRRSKPRSFQLCHRTTRKIEAEMKHYLTKLNSKMAQAAKFEYANMCQETNSRETFSRKLSITFNKAAG